jgi:hypothetical protein
MRCPVILVPVILLLVCMSGQSCKPKKLENGRAIAEEVERRTVKRFTEKQILAEAVRVGDRLTRLADSLTHRRLPASLRQGGIAAALKNYPPASYPEVQALALKYGAKPARQRRSDTTLSPGAQARMLNNTELLYTRAIYLTQTCLPCHGKAIPPGDLRQLQERKPLGPFRGLQEGDLAGFWFIPIQRKAILESLTLKDMKKKPGPG